MKQGHVLVKEELKEKIEWRKKSIIEIQFHKKMQRSVREDLSHSLQANKDGPDVREAIGYSMSEISVSNTLEEEEYVALEGIEEPTALAMSLCKGNDNVVLLIFWTVGGFKCNLVDISELLKNKRLNFIQTKNRWR